jgi:hypothetical protein
MTDSNRFFEFVWRANALVILGVALLAGLLGVIALVAIVIDETSERSVSDLLIVNPERPVQEDVVLGYPLNIAGTTFVRISLFREQRTDLRYYSKSSSGNTVNDLFVNSTTGESSWLFKGTDRLILGSSDIMQKLRSDSPVATAIIYTLADKDTDANGRITTSDHVSVGYSNPQGTMYTPLLNDIEKLFALQQVTDDRLMLLYSKNGESRIATYSLPTFAVVGDSALPKLDAQQP